MRLYLGLGSNLGDRAGQLLEAAVRLREAGLAPVAVSRVYETAPQGRLDQGWFLNCALAVDTDLPVAAALRIAMDVEHGMGRRRLVHWGPRVIDVDILLYGEERVLEPGLIVPHPRLHERAFALVPLCEIAPDAVIPGRGSVAAWALRRRAEAGQQLRLWGSLPGWKPSLPPEPRRGVRSLLLDRLRSAGGGTVSGGGLALELGVSRSAVWKQVQHLRAAGYDVRGAAGAGYRLADGETDLEPLSSAELVCRDRRLVGRVLHVLRTVDSTNALARQMGLEGTPAGTAVVAEAQTAGRGRHGRRFISSPGGVYLSVVLRPTIPPAQAGRLTLLGAVAVCEALERAAGVSPAIKWPNDILLAGGKVCGILLEMVAREDCVDFVVLGVGVNVRSAPAGVGATSLWAEGARIPRVGVAAALLERLDADYAAFEAGRWPELLTAWRRRSATLGEDVRIEPGDGPPFTGRAVDVTTEGALLVDTGLAVRTVYAGDVTHLRPGGQAPAGGRG